MTAEVTGGSEGIALVDAAGVLERGVSKAAAADCG